MWLPHLCLAGMEGAQGPVPRHGAQAAQDRLENQRKVDCIM